MVYNLIGKRALQDLEAAGAQVRQNGATLQLDSVRLQGYGPFRSAQTNSFDQS